MVNQQLPGYDTNNRATLITNIRNKEEKITVSNWEKIKNMKINLSRRSTAFGTITAVRACATEVNEMHWPKPENWSNASESTVIIPKKIPLKKLAMSDSNQTNFLRALVERAHLKRVQRPRDILYLLLISQP